MKVITRRNFMKSSVAAGAAFALQGCGATQTQPAPFARVRGAHEDLRVAVVGIRGQGGGHIGRFHGSEGARVVAICDVDEKVLNERAADFRKRNEKVGTYIDYRQMLDADKSIDIVSIATPDHQHVPVAAHAILAGKDVYIEKPMSHTIAEGRYLVNLARKYNRIVQHGTQSRSSEGVREGIEYVQSGKLGKCRLAKAINCQRRGKIGHKEDEPIPPHVHYDLWLGPAPKRPFNVNRYHYKWHWWWDYGTGDTGNDGIHQIDIARWGLGGEMPKAATCSGGQLWYDDDHETPDTQMATFEYDEGYVVFEMRLWTPYKHEGHDNGNIFYCDDGWVSIGRSGWQVYYKDGSKGPGGGKGRGSHVGNFLKAVRSRRVTDLTADVEVGHHSAILCHMANTAMRVGRRLRFDVKKEKYIGDDKANKYLTKRYRKGFGLPKA
ncbi:MAG: Gfo/Idh/MocA family oxidoreductase [Planctomycetota bacterium]|jgi:predicted dehydrogenase